MVICHLGTDPDALIEKIVSAIELETESGIGMNYGEIAPEDQEEYVFQKKENVPEFVNIPEDREKPWGTGHAIWCAREAVKKPFLVINADDYYGKEGFKKLHEYMVNEMNEGL